MRQRGEAKPWESSVFAYLRGFGSPCDVWNAVLVAICVSLALSWGSWGAVFEVSSMSLSLLDVRGSWKPIVDAIHASLALLLMFGTQFSLLFASVSVSGDRGMQFSMLLE